MHPVQQLQEHLAAKYHYKPFSYESSRRVRDVYEKGIQSFLKIEGDNKKLYSFGKTLIANGYNRIVIGDYGAYIEFSKEQAIHGAYIVKPGEEYRLEKEYSNVKYNWLTTRDNSDIKIYHQRNTVSYADYKPGYFYVSVYEVIVL